VPQSVLRLIFISKWLLSQIKSALLKPDMLQPCKFVKSILNHRVFGQSYLHLLIWNHFGALTII
ncbi:hypothetical protein L9F63_005943, partial [Diploptera punctata]